MAIRKNKRFIDPRYFMNEKTEKKNIPEKVEVAVESSTQMHEKDAPRDPLDAVMADIRSEHHSHLNTPDERATFVSRVMTDYWETLLPGDQIGLYQLAVQLYGPGLEDETEVEVEPAPEEEEVEITEKKKKKWAKKASDSIEKKGTEGEFTKYCGGDVTQACVDKAARGSSTKRKKQAAFAANINSHDDLKYPKDA